MLCVGAAGAELPWPRLHCSGSQCLLTDGCLGRAVYRCTVHCTATCSLYTVHLVRRKRNCWAPGGAGSCDGQGRMHRRPLPGNRRDLGIWDQWPGWRRLLQVYTDTMTTPWHGDTRLWPVFSVRGVARLISAGEREGPGWCWQGIILGCFDHLTPPHLTQPAGGGQADNQGPDKKAWNTYRYQMDVCLFLPSCSFFQRENLLGFVISFIQTSDVNSDDTKTVG